MSFSVSSLVLYQYERTFQLFQENRGTTSIGRPTNCMYIRTRVCYVLFSLIARLAVHIITYTRNGGTATSSTHMYRTFFLQQPSLYTGTPVCDTSSIRISAATEI